MLAKHIPKDPKIADSFAALARYIAEAREDGEKLDQFWMVNCDAGETLDDLGYAIHEVQATQGLNHRAGPSKTYHLMVSFRAGEKPDADALHAMERAFAGALGFEDHQRVCGSHGNTDHYHFHVAYNRVNRETLRAHTPWNDYRKLEACAREMERTYGLAVDLGMSDYASKVGRQDDAGRRYEALTWEQSFQNYVLEQRDTLLRAAGTARDWQGFHEALGAVGLGIKPRGNGCVIFNAAPDARGETMKPSLVDRQLSWAALTKRLGPFQGRTEAQVKESLSPERRYRPRPLSRHPRQAGLWRRYMTLRKTATARPGLVGRAFRYWKEFLYADALNDPLAMVIIISRREMLDMVLGPVPGGVPRVESALRPVLAAWLASRRWVQSTDSVPSVTPAARERIPQSAVGCKRDDDGNLMVPFRDAEGHVQALRLIGPDGQVKDIARTAQRGLMHMLGRPDAGDRGPIMVAPDFASAAAIRKAVRRPVAVAMVEGEVDSVAQALKQEWPQRAVVPSSALGSLKPAEIRAGYAREVGEKAYLSWAGARDWATPEGSRLLRRWKVRGFGVKQASGDALLVPLRDGTGRIEDVLRITGDDEAERLRATGERQAGLFHLIDPKRRVAEERVIIVTEGYKDAAVIHEATRKPVAMVAEAADLPGAVAALQKRHRDHRIIVAGVDSASAVQGGATIRPPGPAASFHALAQTKNLSAVRATFAEVVQDDAFLLWQSATYAKDAPGPGLKHHVLTPAQRDDTKPETQREWLLPLYDGSGRLAAVQVLGDDLAPAMLRGEEVSAGGAALRHVVGQAKGRHGRKAASSSPVVIAEDYETALGLHRLSGREVYAASGPDSVMGLAEAMRKANPAAEIRIAVNPVASAGGSGGLAAQEEAAEKIGARLLTPAELAVGGEELRDLLRNASGQDTGQGANSTIQRR